MTERGLPIVDGAPACPFVAFEDDRDERATSPDHRHRCYAEPRPAPRALAHQEAYCLSSAFPVCPTFQDWARREAAHSRADGARLSGSGAAVLASEQPQRNPPRNWSAPPPWAARSDGPGPDDGEEDAWLDEAAAAAAGAAVAAAGGAGEEIPRQGRGLSGSYADRVASGSTEAELGSQEARQAREGFDAGEMHDDEDRDGPPPVAARPYRDPAATGAAAASAAASAPHYRERDPGRVAAFEGAGEERAAPAPPRRERRRDSNAPEWERARPAEIYPTLRARRLPELSVPPLLVAVVALALAAAVLFALPGLLGFGNPAAVASPTPTGPAASAPAQSVTPTPVPAPTPQIYLVKAGDTMSKIAKKFGVTLDELIAANAETIPNPDKLQIGDPVIIPIPTPSEEPAAS